VFVSTPGTGEVAVLDEDSGEVLSRIPAGRYPDGLAYVPTTNQVWVSDESGGVETVLDAASGTRVATVTVGGEAGNVRYDPGSDRVLVDVQSHNRVAVLDPRSRALLRTVRLPGCHHDHGLILDTGRAFVACDGNATLLVLALNDFRVLARHRVGDDPDVLALDTSRGLLYVAAESGVLTVLDTTPPEARVTGRAKFGDNAHVVAVDPTTGRAYFPVPDAGDGHPGLLIATATPDGSP
jgi:DNA-binding beta-propeller fold protein YncE